MADTKITALTAITTVDPAADVLPIVDVSDTSMAASGTTKKITSNQILGAGGTATLASATITGDLTVDTNTLKVDSANNRVGIGTASPAAPLDVQGSSLRLQVQSSSNGAYATWKYIGKNSTGTAVNFEQGLNIAADNAFELYDNQNTQLVSRYVSGVSGAHSWFITGTTAMTLNSTGLGVGVSPAATIHAYGSGSSTAAVRLQAASGRVFDVGSTGSGYGAANNFIIYDVTAGSERLRIDASGNCGIGVTPSAWAAGWRTAQVGSRLVLSVTGSDTFVGNNWYNDGAYKFINADYATYYDQTTGKHVWGTSTTSGAVNGVITWNPAMTLDASGNLLVGKSVSLFSTVGVEASGTGFISATNSASTNASTNLSVYSTGAAAFRFYVGLGGTVYATNTTISAISDARLKENVQDIDVGLGAILALKPRKFDWKAGKGKDIKGDRGFIAQEFEQVFPQLVDEWKDEAPEGEAPYKSVRQDLIPVLVKAIQELTARVQTLETR